MATVEWRVRADEFANCNCSYGCPCQFNAPPTYGFCEATAGWKIQEGHFGDVRLHRPQGVGNGMEKGNDQHHADQGAEAGATLRAHARGRDGRVRSEVAAGVKESPGRVPGLQSPEDSSSGTRQTDSIPTGELLHQKSVERRWL